LCSCCRLRALQRACGVVRSEIARRYKDRSLWNRKALLNIARMGKFSSDRTIREYARDIWKIKPAVIGNFAHAALLEE